MVLTDRGIVSVETGLVGDWRGKQKMRQVTILFADDWAAAVADLDSAAPWTIRRATLLVSGIANPRREGDILMVGGARMVVTGETQPCSRMDEQLPGLQAALAPAWRGGLTARVIEGGEIAVGDRVELIEA